MSSEAKHSLGSEHPFPSSSPTNTKLRKFEASTTVENSSDMSSNGTSNGNATNAAIDEGLYSRQLYVLGHDAMKRMGVSNILVSGMSGLGVEIAKNVVLGGVKSVTVQDRENVKNKDLSSQYFLTQEDIGKNRAEVSAPQINELNPYVHVESYTGDLTEEFLSKFKVVVLTQSTLEEQLRIGDYAHANGIHLVIADTKGLCGQIFCDFGDKFTVYDANGEPPISIMLGGITVNEKGEGIVACLEENRHGFESGDYVKFDEVLGMDGINNSEPREVTVLGPYTFSIGDVKNLSQYIRGGVATQIKMPKTVVFKSYREALDAPEFIMTDFAKFETPGQMHVAFKALHQYVETAGALPEARNKCAAAKFLKVAEEVNESLPEGCKQGKLDEKFFELFAKTSRGDLCPMQAVVGGIVAQEVMKACSGKFMPIKQFLYYDALECLEGDSMEPLKDGKESSRYDSQMAVFGESFQQDMANQTWFVVGAGAIGCELLKNFSMMGLGCKLNENDDTTTGKIYVTDMDTIEKSNLNRQFLFRPHDVQKMKSHCAASAVNKMNPLTRVTAFEDRVGADTENIYNDDFFAKLNGVANALDNVQARTYMDRKCVYYRLPLLESGTLGTKGNVQVVLPYLTESYSSSQDPPEKSIPICTLKNFPNAIEHTLQWARDEFEGLFKNPADTANSFISDSKFYERTCKLNGDEPAQCLETVYATLVKDKPNDFVDCIKWARNRFQELYHNNIKQLLYNFPADQTTTTGSPFWSGPKRCPHALDFDINNVTHMDYVVSTANLRASMFSLKSHENRKAIIAVINEMVIPEFSPKSGVKIATTEAEANAQSGHGDDDEDLYDRLKHLLPTPESFGSFRMSPIDFEKDDDSNFHMDFIVATSNLRAENYKIAPANRHKSKLIAGKIIPAIATTTALVAGLVSIEMYKVVRKLDKRDFYKNGFINLALPFFAFSEPMPAHEEKYYDIGFSLWDRFDLDGTAPEVALKNKEEMTLGEFLEHFLKKHKLEVTMLSQGNAMIYSFFLGESKRKERMGLKMSDVVQKVAKRKLLTHEKSMVFEMCCNDLEDNDVDVPYVRYVFRH